MPHQLPKTKGVVRSRKTSSIHEEVVRNLQDIADAEDKTFSYVVTEIVYAFFGLKVSDDVVTIARARRKASTRKGRRATHRRYVRRVAGANVLPFEKRRNEKRSA